MVFLCCEPSVSYECWQTVRSVLLRSESNLGRLAVAAVAQRTVNGLFDLLNPA